MCAAAELTAMACVPVSGEPFIYYSVPLSVVPLVEFPPPAPVGGALSLTQLLQLQLR